MAIVLAGCATDPGVVTESARRPAADATPTHRADRSAGHRPGRPSTAPATDPPATAPPATTPAPTDPPAAIGDVARPRRRQATAALRRSRPRRRQRHPAVVVRAVSPALYGEAYEPISGGVFAAYPERHDADPRLRHGRADVLRGDRPLLGVLLRPGRLHGLRRRRAGRAVPASPTARPVDPHASCWPTSSATPSRPAPASSTAACPRSPPSSRPTASPGRGWPACRTRRGRRRRVHRRRRAHRAVGDDRRARPARHRPARRRRPRVGVRPGRRLPGRLRRGPRRAAPSLLDDPLPLVDNASLSRHRRRATRAFGYDDEADRARSSSTTSTSSGRSCCRRSARRCRRSRSCPSARTEWSQCCRPGRPPTAPGSSTARRRSRCSSTSRWPSSCTTAIGDFVVGYLLGRAWSEAAQQALGSPLTGEERILASDCLTGAWVADLIPDENGSTAARHRSSSPATSTRRSRPRWSSATRHPATTSSAAVSRRSPPSAKVCSVASTPAPSASATDERRRGARRARHRHQQLPPRRRQAGRRRPLRDADPRARGRAPRARRRRHEGDVARGHRSGHRLPAPDAAGSPTASTPRCAPSPRAPSARRSTRSTFLDAGARRGGHRDRRDLRRRGGAADPPRRAPGRPGVRPAHAARRHRRRLDGGAHRRARRDARRAQLQARRRAPDRSLLPRRPRRPEGDRSVPPVRARHPQPLPARGRPARLRRRRGVVGHGRGGRPG